MTNNFKQGDTATIGNDFILPNWRGLSVTLQRRQIGNDSSWLVRDQGSPIDPKEEVYVDEDDLIQVPPHGQPMDSFDPGDWSGTMVEIPPAPNRDFVWIPEAPKFPGLYANLFDRIPGKLSDGPATATSDISAARQFQTREECQTWCDTNPKPAFHPTEHGFYK